MPFYPCRRNIDDLSLDDTIEIIWKLVDKKKDEIPDLRIFFITEQKWLRVYKGRMEMST